MADACGSPSCQSWAPRGDLFDQLKTWDRQLGADSASSSSQQPAAEAEGNSAGSSDAPCHGAAGLLSFSLSLSCLPRLGEVPVFDLVTSPWDWAGVKASLFSFVLVLRCNETRRRRRAERLSRLPVRVARGPAPRLWQGPQLKAVNTRPLTFREWIRVGQGASPYWVSVSVARATHLRQKEK
ncbi:hypothetical protein INS49_001739 [Diaporthe citri]|uniref:uncharacterized protein n=1 Tax=Diaporthe citri TaxID=83186 RepID=UPI001C7E5149|nr:uncharacterized protein INS49_001739 [Diaporthe citri]KAG6367546.1 hypothetical protein INS49_001739 [Diaporthe citri]